VLFSTARDTIPLSVKYTVWTAVEAVRAAGGPWVGAAAHSLTLGQQAARDTISLSMKFTVWTAVETVRAAGGPWVGAAAHSLTLGQQAARDTISLSMTYRVDSSGGGQSSRWPLGRGSSPLPDPRVIGSTSASPRLNIGS
jgi:multidrug transporter EmrE-like cation transporter